MNRFAEFESETEPIRVQVLAYRRVRDLEKRRRESDTEGGWILQIINQRPDEPVEGETREEYEAFLREWIKEYEFAFRERCRDVIKRQTAVHTELVMLLVNKRLEAGNPFAEFRFSKAKRTRRKLAIRIAKLEKRQQPFGEGEESVSQFIEIEFVRIDAITEWMMTFTDFSGKSLIGAHRFPTV